MSQFQGHVTCRNLPPNRASLKEGGGRLQEVSNIVIWLFFFAKLVAEEKWSRTRGNRNGGSTVVSSFSWHVHLFILCAFPNLRTCGSFGLTQTSTSKWKSLNRSCVLFKIKSFYVFKCIQRRRGERFRDKEDTLLAGPLWSFLDSLAKTQER